MPLELVVTVAVIDPLNVAPAPLEGAVNVTEALPTGLPFESLTVAWSAAANAVLMAALCGVPAVAVMLDGAPARLVKLKLAVFAAPATLAVTV